MAKYKRAKTLANTDAIREKCNNLIARVIQKQAMALRAVRKYQAALD